MMQEATGPAALPLGHMGSPYLDRPVIARLERSLALGLSVVEISIGAGRQGRPESGTPPDGK